MKKLCVVTGTRAEYGLLKPLIDKIDKDVDFQLQLVVTGMHLLPEFGLTYQIIEQDGYVINEKIEILLGTDTPTGITKAMGLALIGFGEAFARLSPDYILILGDRFEMLSVAIAAGISRIPLIHLHGGETTEGVVDEAMRHSITKHALLHFVSTEEYRKRVIQLGEHPERVFNVGAIGVENIKEIPLLSRKELENSIGFNMDGDYAVCTFHPVTLETSTSKQQVSALLSALDRFPNLKVIFTKANADTDGRVVNEVLENYTKQHSERAMLFASLGQVRYLSTLKYCVLVIGNSSSGIIEAPSFHVPTINIGDRQKGRVQAKSVLNCQPMEEDIVSAIAKGLSEEFRNGIENSKNPYGEGNTSDKIFRKLKLLAAEGSSIKKQFYDVDFEL